MKRNNKIGNRIILMLLIVALLLIGLVGSCLITVQSGTIVMVVTVVTAFYLEYRIYLKDKF